MSNQLSGNNNFLLSFLQMDSNPCYNCGQAGHRSKICPEPQRRTRCPSCNKVNGHIENCPNIGFRSEPRFSNTTVFELQKPLKLEFLNISNVLNVLDNDRKIEIDRIPLWLSVIDAHIGKVGERSLELATSRPMKRHIVIVDKNGVVALSLVFFEKRLTINSRIQIDSNGNVSFNINAQNDVTERIVSKIQIDNNDDIFKVRISWYGHKYVFHVYPDVGPILIDPLHPQKNGPTKKENININAVIKLQDEADDVRLVGNVTSDGNLGRTFSLSFNVRDLDDSMFDLSQQFKDLFANVKRETVERVDANSEAVNRSIPHE